MANPLRDIPRNNPVLRPKLARIEHIMNRSKNSPLQVQTKFVLL